jgi:hypothetical protein
MTDTIHEAPGRQAREDVRLIGTTIEEVDAGALATTPRRVNWPRVRRFALGAAILMASYAAGFFAMRWATHRGDGYQITPAALILLAAFVLIFGVPEVVSAVRHARRRRHPGAAPTADPAASSTAST